MQWDKSVAVAACAALGACGQEEALISEAQAVEAMEAAACAGEFSGGADKTYWSAEGLWDPFGTLGRGPIGQYISLGDTHCPGAEPSGVPPRCPEGSLTHQRGVTIVDEVTNTNGFDDGSVTIVINANLDVMGEGPLWGTFDAALDAGGAWVGAFVGKRSYAPGACDGPLCYIETIRGVGCGEGGAVDGMKLKFREVIVLDMLAPRFTSTLEGVYF